MKKKNLLQAARKKSGKTQIQVANESGINLRLYQKYEYGNGQQTIQTAIRIADALGSTVEELWGRSPAAV